MRRAILFGAIVLVSGSALAISPAEPLGNEVITYSYDAQGRVIEVKRTGTVNNNVTANYSYDDANNRKTTQVSDVP